MSNNKPVALWPQSQISSLWRLTKLAWAQLGWDLDWLPTFGGSPSQLSSRNIMMKHRGVVASQGRVLARCWWLWPKVLLLPQHAGTGRLDWADWTSRHHQHYNSCKANITEWTIRTNSAISYRAPSPQAMRGFSTNRTNQCGCTFGKRLQPLRNPS